MLAGFPIAAEADLSETLQLKVGLIFADDLKAYTEVIYFPMTSYPEFKIGQDVQESLRMALASLYPGVEEIDREPLKGEYDYVLRIGLNRKKCGLRSMAPLSSYASPEFDKTQGKVHFLKYTLSISIEILDGKKITLLKKQDVEENWTYIQREDPDQPTAQGLEFETRKFANVVKRPLPG